MGTRYIVASPNYLKTQGTPKQPQDLEHHQCLLFRSKNDESIWELNKGTHQQRIKVSGQFVANDLTTLKELAIHDNGLALLPELYCKEFIEKGSLVRILQDWKFSDTPINAVYSIQRFIPAKLQLFLDELEQRLDLPWSCVCTLK